MKKLVVLLLGLLSLSFGCIPVQSYTKPNVDFSTFKKIAIVKLKAHDEALSQIVTDHVATGFRKSGFNIIEREQLKILIDENHIIQSGLTDTDRSILSRAGVDAIILGAIAKRDTWKEKYLFSVKMYDIRTGEVIWSAFAHELEGDDLGKLPKSIANSIQIKKKGVE